MKKYLTPEQVAKILQVNVKTVHKLAREQKLPHAKITGRIKRFSQKDIKKFFQDHMILPPRRFDKKTVEPLSSKKKGGGKSVEDNGTDLRKEIGSLCP